MQDELRIRYLQFTMKRMEDFHEKEMQEMEIRLRNKMHGYARACLETLGFELKSQFKFTFVQFEKFKKKEEQQRVYINQLEEYLINQERQIEELTKFIKWEEISHKKFTESLRDDGVTLNDIYT